MDWENEQFFEENNPTYELPKQSRKIITPVGPYDVDTAYTGDIGPVGMWETMVFDTRTGPPALAVPQFTQHSGDWEQARVTHEAVVAEVRAWYQQPPA